MNAERNERTTTNSPGDLPLQHQVTDPITGTTAAGPLESGRSASGTGGWGVAARWLAFAFLLVVLVIAIYWISG